MVKQEHSHTTHPLAPVFALNAHKSGHCHCPAVYPHLRSIPESRGEWRVVPEWKCRAGREGEVWQWHGSNKFHKFRYSKIRTHSRTSELHKIPVVLDHIKTKHNRIIPENGIQKDHFPHDTSTMLLIKLASVSSKFTW